MLGTNIGISAGSLSGLDRNGVRNRPERVSAFGRITHYARFNFFQSDDVRFYQIPDRILMDFGVSVNDPFNNESEPEC